MRDQNGGGRGTVHRAVVMGEGGEGDLATGTTRFSTGRWVHGGRRETRVFSCLARRSRMRGFGGGPRAVLFVCANFGSTARCVLCVELTRKGREKVPTRSPSSVQSSTLLCVGFFSFFFSRTGESRVESASKRPIFLTESTERSLL